MPDEVLRYRAEVDTASLQAQLGAVQAQLSQQLAQMVQPVGQAVNYSYQLGAQGLMAAQDLSYRAQAQMQMIGGIGTPLVSPSLSASVGQPIGFGGLAAAAAGIGGRSNFMISPGMQGFLAGRELTDRFTDATASAARGGLQISGGWYGGLTGGLAGGTIGSSIGSTIGAALGTAFAPGIGTEIGATAGALIGGWKGMGAGGDLGYGLGQSMYGPLGGAGLGAAAGWIAGAPVAPLAAVGAALMTPVQLGLENYGNQAQIRDFLRENAGLVPFGKSTSVTGLGFTRGEENKISQGVMDMAARDPRFDSLKQALGAYNEVMQAGVGADLYQGQTTADAFLNRTRELVSAVKRIQGALGTSYEESIQMMQGMAQLGITRGGEFVGASREARATAFLTGKSPLDMLGSGLASAAMTQGTSTFGTTGFQYGLGQEANLALLRQGGAIRGLGGEDLTQRFVAGAGGQQAAVTAMQAGELRYRQGPEFTELMMAAFDPATGKIDKGFIERYNRGGSNMSDVMNKIASNYGSKSDFLERMTKFEENRGQIEESLGPVAMGSLRRNIIESAGLMGRPLSRESFMGAYRPYAEEMGLSEPQARLMGEALFNLPQLQRQQARAQRFVDQEQENSEMARASGLSGLMRSAWAGVRGGVNSIGAAVAAPFQQGFSAIEEKYNTDVLGLTPTAQNVRISNDDALNFFRGRPLGDYTTTDLTSDRGWASFGAPRPAQYLQQRFALEAPEYETARGKARTLSPEMYAQAEQIAAQSGNRLIKVNESEAAITYIAEDRQRVTEDQKQSRDLMQYASAFNTSSVTADQSGIRQEIIARMRGPGQQEFGEAINARSYTDFSGTKHTVTSANDVASAAAVALGYDPSNLTGDQRKQLYQVASEHMNAETLRFVSADQNDKLAAINRRSYEEQKKGLDQNMQKELQAGIDKVGGPNVSEKSEAYTKIGRAVQDVLGSLNLTDKKQLTDYDVLEKAGLTDKDGKKKEGVSEADLTEAKKMIDVYRNSTTTDDQGHVALSSEMQTLIKNSYDIQQSYKFGEFVDRTKDSISKMDVDGTKQLEAYKAIEAGASISKSGVGAGGLFDVVDILNETDPAKRQAKMAELKKAGVDVADLERLSSADVEAFQAANEPMMRAARQADVLYDAQKSGLFTGTNEKQRAAAAEELLKGANLGDEEEEGEYKSLAEGYSKMYREGAKGLSAGDITGIATRKFGADTSKSAGNDPSKAIEGLLEIPEKLDGLAKAVNGTTEQLKVLTGKL